MQSNRNIKEITPEECKEIQGGGLGYDIGWLLGNTITGNLSTPVGIAEAIADYVIHYNVEE